jgi:hypothetical protein
LQRKNCTCDEPCSIWKIRHTVHLKTENAALLPLIGRFVDERSTYGYRRIAALVNRELTRKGWPSSTASGCTGSCSGQRFFSNVTRGGDKAVSTAAGNGHALKPVMVFGRALSSPAGTAR